MPPETDLPPVLGRQARRPDITLTYRSGADAEVDVWAPPPGDVPAPLVIVVHGGFWRPQWDRAHAAPQSAGLAEAGYVVACVEYRRVGWPGIFDDLALLTDVVPSLVVSSLGPAVVDAARTVLVGHSAGAHLALWAASRHRLPAGSPWRRERPLDLRGVVALGGVVDLGLASRLGLGAGATEALLGGPPTSVPDRYASADPVRLLPAAGKIWLIHGTDDADVPASVSQSYADAAARAGSPMALRLLEGCGHFEVIDPLSTAWPAVLAAVDSVAGIVRHGSHG